VARGLVWPGSGQTRYFSGITKLGAEALLFYFFRATDYGNAKEALQMFGCEKENTIVYAFLSEK